MAPLNLTVTVTIHIVNLLTEPMGHKEKTQAILKASALEPECQRCVFCDWRSRRGAVRGQKDESAPWLRESSSSRDSKGLGNRDSGLRRRD